MYIVLEQISWLRKHPSITLKFYIKASPNFDKGDLTPSLMLLDLNQKPFHSAEQPAVMLPYRNRYLIGIQTLLFGKYQVINIHCMYGGYALIVILQLLD